MIKENNPLNQLLKDYVIYWFIETILSVLCYVLFAALTFILRVAPVVQLFFWVRNVNFAMYIFKRTCIFAWNSEIISLSTDNTIHTFKYTALKKQSRTHRCPGCYIINQNIVYKWAHVFTKLNLQRMLSISECSGLF